jgi:hypothetical protein
MECVIARLQQLPTNAAALILWSHVQSMNDNCVILFPRCDYSGDDSSVSRDGEVDFGF